MICLTFLLNSKTSSHLSSLQTMQRYRLFWNNQSAGLLQACLNNISNLADKWHLKLSLSKCSVLQFGKIYVINSYDVNGIILPLIKNMSDFRITIDNNLNSKLYINNICDKAKQKALWILKCFTHVINILFSEHLQHMSDLLSSIVVLVGHRINRRKLIKLKVFNPIWPKSYLVLNT